MEGLREEQGNERVGTWEFCTMSFWKLCWYASSVDEKVCKDMQFGFCWGCMSLMLRHFLAEQN